MSVLMMRLQGDPLRTRLLILIGLWVVAILVVSLLSPYFLQASTVPYLLQYVPILGLLGLGQTLVILAGGPGIDLSVGSIVSLVGVSVGALMTMGLGVWPACAVGILLGGVLGMINGVLINVLRIPSLMATLATMFAYGGLALATTEGRPIGNFPQEFAWLGQGDTLTIPNSFLFVLVPVALILHIMLTRTTIGRHIVACGNDDRAAHLSGLNVVRLRIGLYVLSGVLAAIGSIISLSWFLAARPDAGKGMELAAVTIAVLGGTHIFGGTGGIPGTLVAILIITTLQIGLQLANISAAWQLGIIGVLLIASVASFGGWRQIWSPIR
ncbi:ABC transporter permease [Phyllobacterium endophyticum]|uniref:ABC transporter permease n=1 Tax=Phyllobacterium endophyticum TaxID=1149773 RepID=A0A2P7AQY5_9HYPH|nr:ABC transporter permease [Phyllobacterium endophyticum]MBB3237278.1 ribose/xylose/arabinose/galactoside ABC-type transport system permease subunit [Phyllobacterium endophyticum]PSH56646.1 ABC transporter permease [Phyllobacterium endophyticum]TYR44359.1 ABC transporter permease [Phyllobacterium endophyticum]